MFLEFSGSEDRNKKGGGGEGIGINIGGGGDKKVSPKGKKEDPPSASLPQSTPGGMVAYVIGRERIFQPNTLWYGNLEVHYEVDSEIKTDDVPETIGIGGGGGGGGPGNVSTGKVTSPKVNETKTVSGYDLDVHLSVCLGPDVHLLSVYEDNERVWDGHTSGARTPIDTISGKLIEKLVFYDGRNNQVLGAEIAGINPPNYVGIAMVICLAINNTDTFPQLSFEVARYPDHLNLGPGVNHNDDYDVNPMTAAYDIITNPWGGGAVSTGRIDEVSFTAAAVRLAEEGIFISIINQNPGTTPRQILDMIEDQIFGYIFEDPEDGLIKCRLIRWDLYDFDNAIRINESNISELRDLSKGSWVGAATKSVASFTSRENNYSEDIVMAQSPMVAGDTKSVEPARYSYPMAMTSEVAAKCLARDMIIFNQPTWSCEVQSNRVLANALPGDLVLLSWEEYQLEDIPFYVNKRSDVAGDVAIVTTLSELINFRDTVLFAFPETSLFDPPNTEPTSPISAQVISAPYWIQTRIYDDELYNKKIDICTPIYLVEPFNSIQTAFDVRMLNFPDQASPPVGEQPVVNRAALYSSVGQLADPITSLDGFANGIMASLTISGVLRETYMKTVGHGGVRRGEIFMFVDDEIMAFEMCDNLGAGVWELTNIHRGLLDTAPADHAAGTKIYITNGNWEDRIGMSFDIVPEYIPLFKFCSIVPDDKQKDEGLTYSDWEPDDRINRPLRPMAIEINGNRSATPFNCTASDNLVITWKTRSRNKIRKVPIFSDDTHEPEYYNNGSTQKHRVWITDSGGTDYNLGTTTDSPVDPDTLNVTVPATALGPGTLWVEAYNNWGASIQAEHYPINIT